MQLLRDNVRQWPHRNLIPHHADVQVYSSLLCGPVIFTTPTKGHQKRVTTRRSQRQPTLPLPLPLRTRKHQLLHRLRDRCAVCLSYLGSLATTYMLEFVLFARSQTRFTVSLTYTSRLGSATATFLFIVTQRVASSTFSSTPPLVVPRAWQRFLWRLVPLARPSDLHFSLTFYIQFPRTLVPSHCWFQYLNICSKPDTLRRCCKCESLRR